ncbi:Hypothetical predicted protein [Podarcis lilfordi]|uniref:Uncharacterized protein n=1 Tax=Podarcis lilfordi TaxID=74358 RepID=A0AA35NX24_9SAUR|nr:Hypothetical predicted protein [Podarcis lilfordi]
MIKSATQFSLLCQVKHQSLPNSIGNINITENNNRPFKTYHLVSHSKGRGEKLPVMSSLLKINLSSLTSLKESASSHHTAMVSGLLLCLNTECTSSHSL